MTRTLTLTAAVLALVAGLYITNGVLSVDPPVTLRAAEADPGELDRLIEVYDDHVASGQPGPYFSASLGRFLLQRGSSTNDLDDYERAAARLATAFEESTEAGLDLAAAQIALHRFEDALSTLSETPEGTERVERALVSFDAHLGVGDLDAAERSLSDLELRFPGEPSVLTRRAALTYQRGDGDGAAQLASEAADIAISAELTTREQSFYDLAATRYLLAIGESDDALSRSVAATERTPDHPGAWLLRSRAAAAAGNLEAAVGFADRSVALAATPASLSFLADLHIATGGTALAQLQLDTIEAVAAFGQEVLRRELALARAEHGLSLPHALAAARAELSTRPDAYSHHVLATALHAAGDLATAERHAEIALALPDPDVWFRAGLIAFEAGDRDTAMLRLGHALDLAPDFHPLRADAARSLLEELHS